MIASIWPHYFHRSILPKMFSQNYGNGLQGIITWQIISASFSPRHTNTFAFVLLGEILAAMVAHVARRRVPRWALVIRVSEEHTLHAAAFKGGGRRFCDHRVGDTWICVIVRYPCL